MVGISNGHLIISGIMHLSTFITLLKMLFPLSREKKTPAANAHPKIKKLPLTDPNSWMFAYSKVQNKFVPTSPTRKYENLMAVAWAGKQYNSRTEKRQSCHLVKAYFSTAVLQIGEVEKIKSTKKPWIKKWEKMCWCCFYYLPKKKFLVVLLKRSWINAIYRKTDHGKIIFFQNQLWKMWGKTDHQNIFFKLKWEICGKKQLVGPKTVTFFQ